MFRKTIPLFISFVICSLSLWGQTPSVSYFSAASAGLSLSGSDSMLPAGLQTGYALEAGASLNKGNFILSLAGGGIGVGPSPMVSDVSYRGFTGLYTGTDLSFFPSGGNWGLTGGVKASFASYGHTHQWFFYPSLAAGGSFRVALAPGAVEIRPSVEFHFRRGLRYSAGLSLSIRLSSVLFNFGGSADE